MLAIMSISHLITAQAVGTPYVPNIDIPFSFLYGGINIELANSVIQTTDGGYITAGSSTSSVNGDVTGTNHGGSDFWVVKYNEFGKIEWQRLYGGSGSEEAFTILQTTDGGYLVSGTSSSSANGDVTGTSHGASDYWVIKLTATGNIEWDRLYGGAGNETRGYALQASDGGYIIAGRATNSKGTGDVENFAGPGNDFCWIVKISASGTLQWQKLYGNTGGGSSYPNAIASTADGSYIVTGFYYGPTNTPDVWVFKINASGTIQWQKTFGGSGTEEGYDINQTADGGYMVTGYSNSSASGDVTGTNNGSYDTWTLKLDVAGELQWQKLYGGAQSDIGYKIFQNADGSYMFFGTSSSSNTGDITATGNGGIDLLAMKLDSSGNILWLKLYGGLGSESPKSFSKTADGGYIIAGLSPSASANTGDITDTHNGWNDLWLLKLDSSGNIVNVPDIGQR